MKLYGNNEKDIDIKLRIGTGDDFSYEELQTFHQDGLLEDYDLFHVSSKLFDNVYMYYQNGNYYLISRKHNVKHISPQLMQDRRFVVASRSVTNNVQHYKQLYGPESLKGLSQQELLKIIMGPAYEPIEQIELQDLKQELEK